MAQMKYYYELTISSSPHAHTVNTTRNIMRHVLIALTPALIGSVYFFGWRALAVCLVSMAACFTMEKLWCRFMHQNDKTYDLSALVTGLLLAYVCPPTIPYWQLIIGDAFAILLVKMLFGGIGKNLFNPALAARAFLFSWPVSMSTWIKVGWETRQVFWVTQISSPPPPPWPPCTTTKCLWKVYLICSSATLAVVSAKPPRFCCLSALFTC